MTTTVVKAVEAALVEAYQKQHVALPLGTLVTTVRETAPDAGSTDVKLAVFSLVRTGKAEFDDSWRVRPRAAADR